MSKICNHLDGVYVKFRLSNGGGEVDATLVLLLKGYVWRSFVQSDTKSFEFIFENFLVLERFQYIEHHEDEATGPCHCDSK